MSDDETKKPGRTYRTLEMPCGELVPTLEAGFTRIGAISHGKSVGDEREALARELIVRWGMITGDDGGEDSSGRAKMRKHSPKEVVAYACDVAEEAMAEFERRGFRTQMPSYAEWVDMARDNDKRN